MKLKVYIAGSCKNMPVMKCIMKEIERWGHEIITDWTRHQQKGNAKEYAEEDIKGLNECDCLIYCMDGIHSRGKYFELGYVTALRKPIVIFRISTIHTYGIISDYDNEQSPSDVLLDDESIFIKSKLYTIIGSDDELRKWL